MCTAISFKTINHYFGRTLDLEYLYKEEIVITPKFFPYKFKYEKRNISHYAHMGIATVSDSFPLYYEAVNEKGLGIAGLSFPEYAHYSEYKEGKINVASFEFIPFLLSRISSVNEALPLLRKMNVTNDAFSEEYRPFPLHWLVSDREESVVVEPRKSGLKIYKNPVGLLTNNPPFDFHMTNLSNFANLTAARPKKSFAENAPLKEYSKGMGAIGLPGDLSSASRFVRGCFTKLNSVSGDSENESVSQFFHILGSVSQTRGCVDLENSKYEITNYTSCYNTDKGILYYTTYENTSLNAVDMRRENLNTDKLIIFPIINKQQINFQN